MKTKSLVEEILVQLAEAQKEIERLKEQLTYEGKTAGKYWKQYNAERQDHNVTKAENSALRARLEPVVVEVKTCEMCLYNIPTSEIFRAVFALAIKAACENNQKPAEYQNHEFCKDVECGAFDNERCYSEICHKTAKHFHRWLEQNGYKIIKTTCEGE